MYITDNWRAFRTWGVSANQPAATTTSGRCKDGVDRGPRGLQGRLGQPPAAGLQPRLRRRALHRAWTTSFKRADWVPSAAAEALYRNNMPLLAYIGGKPERFTSKDHNFLPGETVEKQLIVINNSRET